MADRSASARKMSVLATRVAAAITAALGPLAVAGHAATTLLPQEPRLEDVTKAAALYPPDGFYFSEESDEDVLVLSGPRQAGSHARLELRRVLDGRPTPQVLDDFLATHLELEADAERTPWPVSRRDDTFGSPLTVDHVQKRKRLRAGLAAQRHGPWVLILRTEATVDHFEQLRPEFHDVLRDLELLPREADWTDDGLGVRLYWLPDWLEVDAEQTRRGQRGAWIWQSPDKELTATLQAEMRPVPADARQAYDDYEKRLRQGTSVAEISRDDTWVSGEPAALYTIIDRGGQARWELHVAQGDRLVVVALQCPASMAEGAFEQSFKKLVALMTVHES